MHQQRMLVYFFGHFAWARSLHVTWYTCVSIALLVVPLDPPTYGHLLGTLLSPLPLGHLERHRWVLDLEPGLSPQIYLIQTETACRLIIMCITTTHTTLTHNKQDIRLYKAFLPASPSPLLVNSSC